MSIFKLIIHIYDKQNASTCTIIQSVINYIYLKRIILSTNSREMRNECSIFRLKTVDLICILQRQNIYHGSKQKRKKKRF